MCKKLLYINTKQFGYHIDSFNHCKNLKHDFEISYICFDYGYDKISMPQVNIIYVSWSGSYFAKGLRFLRYCVEFVKQQQKCFVFAVYFPLVSIFKLWSGHRNVILDIRTGGVNHNNFNIWRFNSILWMESLFFDRITIISESLRKTLGISKSKVFILPLGADIMSTNLKTFSELRLFYVGTFIGRRLFETVKGLNIFLSENKGEYSNVSYDIFGDGLENDKLQLEKAIEEYGLEQVITLHGRKTHAQLKDYFENCNVGVCYVPKTDFFDCQPSTKMYEYVNSGMVCLATETSENKLLITQVNGILCKDTPEGFANGLKGVLKKKDFWNSDDIRKTLASNTWAIICEDLKRYILKG